MRLIDADALKRKDDDAELAWILDNAPTVDAVVVVRCKDCRWGKELCGNIECSVDSNIPPEYHGYEWFCPSGKRRSE